MPQNVGLEAAIAIRLDARRGDPWSKIRTIAPVVIAEIGDHISFGDIAEAAGSRADNLHAVLTKLAQSSAHCDS